MKWPSIHPSLRALLLLGVIAIVCGTLAFWGSQRYLANYSASVERRWEKRYSPVRVVVAARDLPAGHVVSIQDLASRDMPSAFIPASSWRPEDITALEGRALAVAISRGDPVTRSVLIEQDERALAARLRPGARAVTVPVDDVSSQGGLVRPGDRIDLLLAEESVEGVDRCVTVRPLLESLAVLATGREQSAEVGSEGGAGRGYSTITLDASPDQAQALAAALRVGELIPLLRGPRDEAPAALKTIAVGQRNCRSVQRSEASTASQSEPRRWRIELVVGGETQPIRTQHWVSRSDP